MNRRSFLTFSAMTFGAAALFKTTLNTTVSFAQGALKELKLKDSEIAKNGDKSITVAQYCENAEKDSKFCPDRQKPERKGQNCGSCQFYTAKGLHKGQEVGACTLIPGKHVPKAGWCQTWVKKA